MFVFEKGRLWTNGASNRDTIPKRTLERRTDQKRVLDLNSRNLKGKVPVGSTVQIINMIW